jgi:DNA-binding MarR family transcriptional regulator
MTKNYSEAEKTKLKELITEGIQVLTETDTLKEALGDTVKAIAEELDMKPAILNRAIRTAYKADLTEKREALSDMEDVLVAVGREF